MWTAIIGAVLAVIGAITSGVMAHKATKETNDQNQQNYEDWKEYNTPANQMNRLQDAGLNPYMVNGVSNTLSQPFQVQNNLGLSSLFSQFSSAMAQGVSGMNKAENNAIGRERNEITKDKVELERINTQTRIALAKNAIKVGDARAALLWSQGSLADLNAKFWQDMDDVRRNRYISDATIAASNADFLTEFNPLRLGYYRQFYPLAIEGQAARNAYTRKQTSHLSWSEAFLQSKLEQEMALAWAKQSLATRLGYLNVFNNQDRTANDWALGSGRLALQGDYYSLAHKKWLSDMYFRWRGQNHSLLNNAAGFFFK